MDLLVEASVYISTNNSRGYTNSDPYAKMNNDPTWLLETQDDSSGGTYSEDTGAAADGHLVL